MSIVIYPFRCSYKYVDKRWFSLVSVNLTKMCGKVFHVVKVLCKVLGVYSYNENKLKSFFAIIINQTLVFLLLALAIPCSIYLFYSTDVGEAAEVLSVLFALFLNLGQYVIFIFSKSKLKLLFERFQQIVDESKHLKFWIAPFYYLKFFIPGTLCGNVDYKITEQKVQLFSIRFYKFVTILFIIVLGMPFYVALFHLIVGTYDFSVWFLPYKVMCVWETTKLSSFNKKINFLHFHMPDCRLIKRRKLVMRWRCLFK